jgi:V/A-type H+/Na+-transporting ATPase subunit D
VKPSGIPPGRAGRIWLIGRLRLGRRAADLLDRKLSILRTEQLRLRRRADLAAARWQDCWREADQWGLRNALMGTAREIRLCAPAGQAHVAITWSATMGVRYPSAAGCEFPHVSSLDRAPGTGAVVEAQRAFQAAVESAVETAAANAAVAIVDEEVTATRRRLRAINDRWLPRLESALATLNHDLDENEREENFRLRWAADRAQSLR